jgi:BirA family transcriptional regulator, biotin operon repressor / biotin---[acetyl-CoA-carboxylase] ligase
MVAPLKILHFKRLESTNTTAYRLAEQSAPDWTVVVADVQTKGRGRGRNKWKSPKGGLWFSIILRPKLPGSKLPLLQFLTAIATRTALEDETGLGVKLKWPNDLVIGKEKLGGILVESKTLGAQISYAILGVGLNINQDKAQLPLGAISLQLASGRQHNIRLLLTTILRQIRSSFDLLDQPSKLMEEWWRNCVHRPMRVRITDSARAVTGISRGIDENGALLIETDDHRIRRVSEGSLGILDD